jgi:hypothetical protein
MPPAQQHPDHADVDLLLQQVGGEGVVQRVHRHALVDLGRLGSSMDGTVELPRAQRVHRIKAREQPAVAQDLALGMAHTPPHAQPLQQDRREHGVAVLRPLPCTTRSVMRWLSTSPTLSATTSLARKPVP